MLRNILLVILTLFPCVTMAGGNIQLLNGSDRGFTITGEYAWKNEHCGGLSFVDLYENQRFFTNNIIDCGAGGKFFISGELSANNVGETLKLGIGRSFEISGLKVFRITAYPGVWSDTGDVSQIKAVWLTEDLVVSEKLSLYSTGFARFRKDLPTVYQPQIWLKKSGSRLQLGIEVFGVGENYDPQIAMKVTF